MKKTTYYYLFILPLIFVFGVWLQGFWGGFLAGTSLVPGIIFFIGQRQAKKLQEMMDKKLTDKILYKNDTSTFH